jgi:hypothetical protein
VSLSTAICGATLRIHRPSLPRRAPRYLTSYCPVRPLAARRAPWRIVADAGPH